MLCGTGLLRSRDKKAARRQQKKPLVKSPSPPPSFAEFTLSNSELDHEPSYVSPIKRLCLTPGVSGQSFGTEASGLYENIVDEDIENRTILPGCLPSVKKKHLLKDSLLLPDTPVASSLRSKQTSNGFFKKDMTVVSTNQLTQDLCQTTPVFKKPCTPSSRVWTPHGTTESERTCTLLSSRSSVFRRFVELTSPQSTLMSNHSNIDTSSLVSKSSLKSCRSVKQPKSSTHSTSSSCSRWSVDNQSINKTLDEIEDKENIETCRTVSGSDTTITSTKMVKVKPTGQLKISLALERNTLSVHIVEASNLRSTWKDLCDPYVQLQVCPDDDECISRKRTVIRNDTNSPFYDQTFTYPIDVSLPENKKKRLIISAWHQDVRKNCAEFLGCMSFGLSHLAFKAKGKKMEGWYHFLPEESGHKKHLQVNASILATKTPSNNPLETTGSARETFTLAVHRVQEGFGFTVKGACPCRVGRVKRGGPAHSVGLQHGDIIREINGIDVRRSTAESLAVIIRKASHMVVLEVYRSNKAHMDSSCASSRLSSIPSIDLNHAIMEVQDENCPPPFSLTSESKSTSFSRRTVIGSSCKNILNEQALDSGSKRKAFVCDRTETKDVTIQSVKWDPEMSAIERSDSCSTMDLNPHLFKNFMSMPNLSELEDEEEEDCAMNIATVDDSEDDIRSKDLETSWADESAMNNTSLTVDMHLPWQGECTLSDDDLVGGSTACGRRDVFSDASGSSGNKSDPQQSILNATLLAQSVQELVNIEKDFASRIIAGIGCYSRPMRHCLPSLKKHRYLFQNLEKIAQTSTYLAKALKEEKESAGTVYASRIEILCEMYEMYLSGLPRAQQLLSDLETDAQFHEFLKLTARSTGISIHELISQPVHHIKTLHTTLKTIQSHATVNSSEYMHLSAVISELETTMTQQRHHMPENQTSLKKKKASISDSMLSLLSDMSAMTTIGSTSSRDEMVDLQSFLVIPKHIKKFKLANGRRHLVHSGDVEAQDGRPMVIVLLSDLLLITIVTEDGDSLLVLQEPMLLENMQLDCDRKNVCEFSISTPVRNGVGYHQVIFSVESEEEKKTWKKHLEHRITSCNRQSYSELPSTSQVLDVL